MHVLFVCLGNICRSPTAEAVFRASVARQEMTFTFGSRGTGGWHEGEGADARTVKHAQMRGLDLTSHRARQLRLEDFTHADALLAMDKANLRAMQVLCPKQQRHKLSLFLEDAEVPDPYSGGPAGFELVLDLCEARVGALLRRWVDAR
jgi:protein-tyrosine phosphatase